MHAQVYMLLIQFDKREFSMFEVEESEILEEINQKLSNLKSRRLTLTIAFFDLADSTRMKLDKGHNVGKRASLLHNQICFTITNRHEGKIIKDLGDGCLLTFDDPLNAINAALEIRTLIDKTGEISTKAGLTHGYVEEIEINGTIDLIGSTVDRCARIESMALPGQILIDYSLLRNVESFLRDDPNIIISPPVKVNLKGIGETLLHEISKEEEGFHNNIIPFNIYETGRLSMDEKVLFMKFAKKTVIELGTGLTSFSDYFISRRPEEFKNEVVNLLKKGVNYMCLLLDPNWDIAIKYAEDRKEYNLLVEIKESILKLKTIQKEFKNMNLKGEFEIRVYSNFPYFHALVIDPEDENARMRITNYLYDTTRSQSPVMQFGKIINEILYQVYWNSIQSIYNNSKII